MAQYEVTTSAARLEYDNDSGYLPACYPIDANHFINFWSRSADGRVQVFEVNTTTWGISKLDSPLVFNGNITRDSACYQVDTNHFINFFQDGGGGGDDGFAQIFEVNTTTWAVTTAAARLEFDTVTNGSNDCFVVDTNHFINFWAGVDGDGFAQVFEVNTTTWGVTTAAARLEFDTVQGSANSCYEIDTNHFINFWTGEDSDGFAQVFEVNTTTWAVSTAASRLEYDTVVGRYPSCYKIDTNHFINFWGDSSGNMNGYAQVFTVNTTTWAISTAGAKLTYGPTESNFNDCTQVDSNHFINFWGGITSTDGWVQTFEVNTSTWEVTTAAARLEFDTIQGVYNSAYKIDTDHFINFWMGTSINGFVQVFGVELPPDIVESTFTGDASLKSIESTTFTSNATIMNQYSDSFYGDATIMNQYTDTFTGDAVIMTQYSVSFTGDASLATQYTSTFTSDANLKQIDISSTFTGDASLKSVESITFTGDAHLDNNMFGYPWQVKVWYDGARYWRGYYNRENARIEFEYTTDHITWTENTNARVSDTGITNDFSIRGDGGTLYLVFSDGTNIINRKATAYPAINFSWASATTCFSGATDNGIYNYPMVAYDGNKKRLNTIATFKSNASSLYSLEVRRGGSANALPITTGVKYTLVSAQADEIYGSIKRNTDTVNGSLIAVWKTGTLMESKYRDGANNATDWETTQNIGTGLANTKQAFDIANGQTTGRTFVFYVDNNNHVHVQKRAPGSTQSWTDIGAIDLNSGTHRFPTCSEHAAEDFHFDWLDYNQHARARYYNQNTNVWTPTLDVASTDRGDYGGSSWRKIMGNCPKACLTYQDSDNTVKTLDIQEPTQPTAPTSLECEGETDPNNVSDLTPELTAIYNDAGAGDTADKYQVEVRADGAAFISALQITDLENMSSSGITWGTGGKIVIYGLNDANSTGGYLEEGGFTDGSVFSQARQVDIHLENVTCPAGSTITLTHDSSTTTVIYIPAITTMGDEVNLFPTSNGCTWLDAYFTECGYGTGTAQWVMSAADFTVQPGDGERCENISYAGTALSLDGSKYYWQIRMTDREFNWSPWSAEAEWTMLRYVATTFTSDANLLKLSISPTFTSNSNLLRQNISPTFTGDSNLLRELSPTQFTGDANLLINIQLTFTGDATIMNRYSDTFTGDSSLKRIISTTFTSNSNLKKVVSPSFTGDTNLKRTNISLTFTGDSSLAEIKSATFTGDTSLLRIVSLTFTSDTNLVGTETPIFTGDASLKQTDISTTFTGDSSLKRILSTQFTSDSNLLRISVSPTFTGDAAIMNNYSNTFTGDARIMPAKGIDTFTKLMLHYNGADESTDFIDSSFEQHTVTAVANAQLDTARKRFGTASGKFDGTDDHLTVPDNDDWEFGTGDFTIDGWVNYESISVNGVQPFVGQYEDLNLRWYYGWQNDGNEMIFYNRDTTTYILADWSPSIDTWYHCAIVRSSGVIAFYVNGISLTLTNNDNPSSDFSNITSDLLVGWRGEEEHLKGWMDELRISKGIARWTSNFTPPYTEYGSTLYASSVTGDANLFKVESLTFTGNANLKRNNISPTFTGDASLIQTDISTTFTGDSSLLRNIPTTFTGDSNLEAFVYLSFTSDTNLKRLSISPTFTGESFLMPTKWWGDANLKRENVSATFTGDASLKQTDISTTFTGDASLKAVISNTFTSDTNLKDTESITFTGDSNLLRTPISTTFTSDAWYYNPNESFSGIATAEKITISNFGGLANTQYEFRRTFAGYVDLFNQIGLTFTGDSALVNDYSDTFTGDASLTRIAKIFTGDANLLDTEAITFTGDASLQLEISSTFTGDSHLSTVERLAGLTTLEKIIKSTIAGLANLEWTHEQTLAGFADLDQTIATTFTGDATIMNQYTDSFYGDSAIMNRYTPSFTGDAAIVTLYATTFTSDATIMNQYTDTFTGDAAIMTQYTPTFTGNAALVNDYSATFTGDASLKRVLSTTFTGDTNLKKTVATTFTSDSNLKGTDVSTTFTGDASLKRVLSDTYTADATIMNQYTDTFTGDAAIMTQYSVSFTGDANLTDTESITFTGDASLKQTDISTTFTGDASLKAIISDTFTGDTNLKGSESITFTSDSNLLRTPISTTFTGDAQLRVEAQVTIAGLITLERTSKVTYAGLLILEALRSTTGFAGYTDLFNQISDTFTGDATLTKTESATFTGDASLLKVGSTTFTGDSTLEEEKKATIAGLVTLEYTATVDFAGIITLEDVSNRGWGFPNSGSALNSGL